MSIDSNVSHTTVSATNMIGT